MQKIERIRSKSNEVNCYVVSNGEECIIFDPYIDVEKIEAYLKEENMKPVAICLTRFRYDHIYSIEIISNLYNIPVYVNPLEKAGLSNSDLDGSQVSPVISKLAEFDLEMKSYELGGVSFKAIATPGNSVGGVSYIFDEFVLTGETLLKSGIGRTDLPGSNLPLLLETVEKTLFLLPDNMTVYPARGESTTIRTEKSVNQFFYKGLSG
ncbi:MBL fold metallo-hydrolase [Paenibacillus sp. P36]|uniref:MBL fold metallo-hydrolase n=1 Tax=Paenibacillus sp. P36 TaxID=3342538 RepID=UPI0038B275B1